MDEAFTFNINKYLGNWCLILSTSRDSISYPEWFIRDDNYNIDISYESSRNNTISISVSMINNGTRFSKSGKGIIIDENSFRVDFPIEEMKQISTHPDFINSMKNTSYVSPNHVIEKIWIDEKDQYIFAIVTNPLTNSFYLLSRDPYPRLSIYNIIMKYITKKDSTKKIVQIPYYM